MFGCTSCTRRLNHQLHAQCFTDAGMVSKRDASGKNFYDTSKPYRSSLRSQIYDCANKKMGTFETHYARLNLSIAPLLWISFWVCKNKKAPKGRIFTTSLGPRDSYHGWRSRIKAILWIRSLAFTPIFTLNSNDHADASWKSIALASLSSRPI